MEFSPHDASIYQHSGYWDRRFEEEEYYEWYKDYSHFRHLILGNVRISDRVLELGCGNSLMSWEMSKDGISEITCTDLSAVAIERMQNRLASMGCQGINFVVVDMLDLPFEDSTFDVVIEKGAMDVLFVNSGDPWNPNAETKKSVTMMLSGIHRVLKPEGVFISITFGQPHFRKLLFENECFTWSMKWTSFGDGFQYYYYMLRKGTREHSTKECQHKALKLKYDMDMVQCHMDSEDYLLKMLMD
eukprot:c15824_g1_i1 orf=453-1184(-)